MLNSQKKELSNQDIDSKLAGLGLSSKLSREELIEEASNEAKQQKEEESIDDIKQKIISNEQLIDDMLLKIFSHEIAEKYKKNREERKKKENIENVLKETNKEQLEKFKALQDLSLKNLNQEFNNGLNNIT